MSELLAHIQELNIKTRAWVAEDPESRWATIVCEDMAMWAERGIYTIAQFQRMCDEEVAFELYQAAFGIKPRGVNFKDMSDEELREAIKLWGDIAKEEMEREDDEYRQKLESFESQVKDAMALGNVDRTTAIRWMMDANDVGDMEQFLWFNMGLSTNDTARIIRELKEGNAHV